MPVLLIAERNTIPPFLKQSATGGRRKEINVSVSMKTSIHEINSINLIETSI